MGLLNYILVSVITTIALPLGIILAKKAKEELKPGEKYINLIVPVSIAAAFLFSGLSLQLHIIIVGVLTGIAFAFFYFQKVHNYILFLILAILFVVNQEKQFFIPFASMVFLVNIAKGTEFFMQKIEWKKITYLALFFLALVNLPLIFIHM